MVNALRRHIEQPLPTETVLKTVTQAWDGDGRAWEWVMAHLTCLSVIERLGDGKVTLPDEGSYTAEGA
jgi:hypothetical protein